jgi:hypothetical protein
MFRSYASMEPGSNIECYSAQNLKRKLCFKIEFTDWFQSSGRELGVAYTTLFPVPVYDNLIIVTICDF